MAKITCAIFTTTRAEFGLYLPLLRAIEKEAELDYLLFVGGTHCAVEHGKTIEEIKQQNIPIDAQFDFLLNTDSRHALLHSLAVETFQLSEIFKQYSFDLVIVLGDRIELLPIITAAIVYNKPIAHLYGGEITQGAIDDQVRNMITKASHLHFVSCEAYAHNLIDMGEKPERVFNVGSLATDIMVQLHRPDKITLFRKYNLQDDIPVVILTYHPVTLDLKGISAREQIVNLFDALESFPFQVIVTAPNMDPGHEDIRNEIIERVKANTKYHFIESLGIEQYHALLPYCEMVIGNSSSGIVEVPFYKIPTVNIGDRQKGRLRHPSVIDVGYKKDEIVEGIKKALDKSFRDTISQMQYFFGNGNTAKQIVDILKNLKLNESFLRK
ncbi:MAG: UDP-N-acetylglucosamine 2-epimerase [Bacteroidales bacterium]|nr:UDP-N-acetylglucosamine 2-epimerase [Bacteroidales bacterium]